MKKSILIIFLAIFLAASSAISVSADGDGHDIGYQCPNPVNCTPPPEGDGGNGFAAGGSGANRPDALTVDFADSIEYLLPLFGK